jgi:hypothetical protein
MKLGMYSLTCMRDYRRGFGSEIRFIEHFNKRPVTTLNYSAIANFHTLKNTTAQAKAFQYGAVSTSRSLITASNSADSSTAPTKSSLHN